MAIKNGKKATVLEAVSNDARATIDVSIPYIVEVKVVGTADILFHRWSVEAVAEKAAAAKGSKAKKSDDLESYVYRADDGCIGLPGEYFRQSIIGAAKFIQDPRSPRKSGMDLFKAAIVSLTDVASLGHEDWDYVDMRRVVVQRNGITRSRPAMRAGWEASFKLLINLPEYLSSELLIQVINNAGRLVGVGDFRPSYGRFQVKGFQVLADEGLLAA